jgi:protein-S-isoprenylcysteine O-methyltransferase Ste14
MIHRSKLWYRMRGALIVPFLLFALLCTYKEVENHFVLLSLGLPFFIIGWFLRIWAQTHLHYRLKGGTKLTITGPYRFVRNPIYIGNIFILASLTVLSELFWFTPIMVLACFFTYHMTIQYEENHLIEVYKQGYVEYLKRVPRWIPHFKNVIKEADNYNLRHYLFPSIFAELHILFLLIPFIIKELFV